MEFVMEGRFGQMVAYHHPDIVGIPLEEAVREQNLVRRTAVWCTRPRAWALSSATDKR
jgi:hypothetical protein